MRLSEILVSGEDPRALELLLRRRIAFGDPLAHSIPDPSHSQFELLAKLTAGWSPGDGRTLFLVGDPMQSIYRFRGAEVEVFRRRREEVRDAGGTVVALDRKRFIVPAIDASRRYAVNVLAEDQQWLSDCFAGANVTPNRDAFCGAAWHPGEHLCLRPRACRSPARPRATDGSSRIR